MDTAEITLSPVRRGSWKSNFAYELPLKTGRLHRAVTNNAPSTRGRFLLGAQALTDNRSAEMLATALRRAAIWQSRVLITLPDLQ
jgi:hypothetical protein